MLAELEEVVYLLNRSRESLENLWKTGINTDNDYFARVYEAMNLFIGVMNVIVIIAYEYYN